MTAINGGMGNAEFSSKGDADSVVPPLSQHLGLVPHLSTSSYAAAFNY